MREEERESWVEGEGKIKEEEGRDYSSLPIFSLLHTVLFSSEEGG